MLDRFISSLVALSLAFLVWLYARSRDLEVLDNIPVPVQIALAPGQADYYDLEVTGPSQVTVSFTGPPSRIRELRNVLQRTELLVTALVTVPNDRNEDARILDTVRIEPRDIHAPPGVMPAVVEGRNRIPVTLHRLVDRRLPVRFESASDLHVAQVTIEPPTVVVRGPQEILDHTQAISTQPFVVPARAEAPTQHEPLTVDAVALATEIEGKRVQPKPKSVAVRLTFQPQQKNYDLTEVPVQFLCPPNFPWRPLFSDERAGKITLRLVGPTGAEAPTAIAYIDLSGRKWEAGLYEEPLKLQLPKDFKVVQGPPRLVAFQLTAADAGTRAGSVPPSQ
jgi:hypothetical protein